MRAIFISSLKFAPPETPDKYISFLMKIRIQ